MSPAMKDDTVRVVLAALIAAAMLAVAVYG